MILPIYRRIAKKRMFITIFSFISMEFQLRLYRKKLFINLLNSLSNSLTPVNQVIKLIFLSKLKMYLDIL